MNNNNLGRVAVRTSKRKRVPTPIPFDVNSTAQIGSIMPYMVREIPADSSISVSTRDLIRLATMNVPTYGRLKLNLRHYFVGISDLTKNFEALLSEQVISRAHGSFRPTRVPYASKGFLSLLSLVGAHVTLYRVYDSSNDTTEVCRDVLYKSIYSQSVAPNQPAGLIDFWKAVGYQKITGDITNESLNNGFFYRQHMPAEWRDAWNGYSGPALNIAMLAYSGDPLIWGSVNNSNTAFWIPIENKDWTSFFNMQSYTEKPPEYFNFDPVPLETADAVISIRQRVDGSPNGYGHLACRFSSFGQRWFNALIACGYGVDYGDFSSGRSLFPIFAYYKAYWESFGLELYRKWETSPIVKMMCAYDDLNEPGFEANAVRSGRVANGESVPLNSVPPYFYEYWCNFVCDVGNMFYTEEHDFTSAHTRDATISPANMDTPFEGSHSNSPTNEMHVLTNGVSDSEGSGDPLTQSSRSPYIATTNGFSQLDIETLKRLYKVVNRNTIAGQNIAKLLELQGLGSYVSSCKSRFIGEFSVPIDIDEVTATSDAFDSEGKPRSLLGEQGAKGVGFGSSKRFKVSTNEFGYYICLAAIVPESGYTNCALAGALNIAKHHFYNPEYDGLGMELNAKELTITAQQDWSDSTSSKKLGSSAFGFVPQYSRHKVQPNFALGGFALRSERSYYRSFFLDKIIDVGERAVTELTDDSDSTAYQVQKLLPVERTPIASPNWRFVGRYPWLESYLRIFAETGDSLRKSPVFFSSLNDFVSNFFDFTFRDEDRFVVQNRFEAVISAPWLKITDSYETKEDGNVGSSDTSIGKE